GEEAGSYRAVLRDRTFLVAWGLMALIVAVVFAQNNATFPPFATGTGGLAPSGLAIAFAANTVSIVVLQLPVLKLLEGRRRTTSLALACGCFGTAWCLIALGAHVGGTISDTAMFAFAMVILGAGETLLSPTLAPIVNDLAPP